MNHGQAQALITDTEAKYSSQSVLVSHDKVKEEGGKLYMQLVGPNQKPDADWTELNGLTRSLCRSLGLSSAELGKYPSDAQIYCLKSKLRVPQTLTLISYNGHPVALRGIKRDLCPMSKFTRNFKEGTPWLVKDAGHDPVRGLLHARYVLPEKTYDYLPDDKWCGALDFWQDYAEGSKLEARAVLMRIVCSNGLMRVYRAASLEGRYEINNEESIDKAFARITTRAPQIWSLMFQSIQRSGVQKVEKVTDRMPRLMRMMGVKTKEVADSIKRDMEPTMQFYSLHNMFTYNVQQSNSIAEKKDVQQRAARMVAEVADHTSMPFYEALFGDLE